MFEIKVASNGNEIKVQVAEDGKQTANEREPDTAASVMEIDTNCDGVVVWQVELVRRRRSVE